MTAADILDGLVRVNLAAGAAIAGVIVLRRLVRRPFGARLAYGLWLLPVLAGAAVLAPPRQVVIVRKAAPVSTPALQVRIPLAGAELRRPLGPAAAPAVEPTAAAPASAPKMNLDPVALLLGLWLAGAGGVALVMGFLQQRFVRQARKGAVGPAVVGVIAPRIVTPRDFGERYSQGEQALVLAHEQAHIARQDSRLNGLSALVQCLCWFNPLVHLGARLMRIDQELACDEAVVTRFPAARRAYAEVLLKAQMATLPLPLGCYWPSKTRHPLVERVALLKLKVVSPARRWTGGAALAILCAGAGVAAWASQPADVRIRIAAPAQNARAAQLAPVAAVAAAAAEMSAADKKAATQTPDEAAAASAPVEIAAGNGPSSPTPAAAPALSSAADATARAAEPVSAGPATEAPVRRWIASLQINQLDDEDMSPVLAEATRQRMPVIAQTFRAFGALKDIRFVRVTPEGEDAYEADFAHGKIRVMAPPLGPDGRLVRLAWGPIWDQDVRGDAVRQATPWATGVEPPVYRLGTSAPSAPASAIPPATPVAMVTSPANAGKQASAEDDIARRMAAILIKAKTPVR